ncbi:PspC domain-containing protein [Paenibacillus koleovorans]|uniref:PspC domain-containing protein n=1 Tax=Paenibacillus koleovorans TaxID=121608 RepID=UPI000FDB1A9E|nr:PspC domain-containing protein [Paenibacillus koleovorans]
MNKLYRSRTDSKLFGLCGGLAQMINVDSTLLRVIVIITAFFSGGTVIPLYFIACLVIPKEPVFEFQNPHAHTNGGYYNTYNGSTHGTGGPRQPYSNGNPGQGPHTPYNTSTGRSTGYQTGPIPGQQGYSVPTQGFNQPPGATHTPPPTASPAHGQPGRPNEATIDEMMRDMEKKMLQREIEELRAKVAQFEQQRNRRNGEEEGQS